MKTKDEYYVIYDKRWSFGKYSNGHSIKHLVEQISYFEFGLV